MPRSSVESARSPSSVDVAVAQRIRVERLSRRMSQTDLARAIGVSFQQVQKYESGHNRVGAGRLTRIADALGIPVTAFFQPQGETDGRKDGEGRAPLHLLTDRAALRLLEAFDGIEDSGLRQAIVRLVELNGERNK